MNTNRQTKMAKTIVSIVKGQRGPDEQQIDAMVRLSLIHI